jgi:CheY-like chemotaxis protein
MRKRILLVDDSSTALMLERAILAQRDVDLSIARDGAEAVAKAVAEVPDLILMDVVMPKMDGFEACRRIREEPRTSAIPIIMVTTRGEPDHVEEGFASGCNDYVTKPIHQRELLEKLGALLGTVGDDP